MAKTSSQHSAGLLPLEGVEPMADSPAPGMGGDAPLDPRAAATADAALDRIEASLDRIESRLATAVPLSAAVEPGRVPDSPGSGEVALGLDAIIARLEALLEASVEADGALHNATKGEA